MTAPDSRDSVERVVAEMREELSYSVHVVEVSVSAFRAWADRLQALARGQTINSPEIDSKSIAGPQDSLVNPADSLVTQAGKDELLGRLDLMADHGWRAPREAAVRIRALEAEVARLRGLIDDPVSGWKVLCATQQAALREAGRDARTLAAALDGAFAGIGRKPLGIFAALIAKYANLNGDQN